MKKFLICEIVIALFALTGFYYFLSNSPPVRMPERPIASAPEVIAAASRSVEKPAVVQVETVSDAEQTVTVAVLPSAEAVSGADAGENAIADSDKSEPDQSELNQSKEAVVLATEDETPADALGKDDIPEIETVSRDEEEASVSDSIVSVIVVGEYVLKVDLLRAQNRLQALNLKSRTEVVSRPTPISRVFLGPFKERREALTMMAVVRDQGDEPFLLIRNGLYKVVIGSFYLQSSVDAWKKLYGAAGFTPKVQKVTIKMPRSLLLLDESQQNCDAVLAQLHDAGFPDARLR